jgi:hypothetical protein
MVIDVQPVVRWATRLKGALTKLIHYACVATFDDEPTTLVKALKRENGKQWKEVANA